MKLSDEVLFILRTWEDYVLWRLEWERDTDTWCHWPFPPWRAEA